MRDRLEDQWTLSICELLKKELDNDKYECVCFERVPYSVTINGYKDNKEDISLMKYEVDLLIKEKRDNYSIPRLIIESKYKKITTHDVITYSNKAKAHKKLYNGLRYGIMVGNSNEKNINSRLINHGDDFDFMFIFDAERPNDKEWNVFLDIVKRNLESADEIENVFNDGRKKDKKRYFCVEKNIKFYE